MDPAGASKLQSRLEQQAHWRQADAVRDGRQPATDPDSEQLERIDEGLRVYGPQISHGVRARRCKQLVDGVWVSGTIAEPGESEHPDAAPAKVASYA
jgi:hypothetical protein